MISGRRILRAAESASGKNSQKDGNKDAKRARGNEAFPLKKIALLLLAVPSRDVDWSAAKRRDCWGSSVSTAPRQKSRRGAHGECSGAKRGFGQLE